MKRLIAGALIVSAAVLTSGCAALGIKGPADNWPYGCVSVDPAHPCPKPYPGAP